MLAVQNLPTGSEQSLLKKSTWPTSCLQLKLRPSWEIWALTSSASSAAAGRFLPPAMAESLTVSFFKLITTFYVFRLWLQFVTRGRVIGWFWKQNSFRLKLHVCRFLSMWSGKQRLQVSRASSSDYYYYLIKISRSRSTKQPRRWRSLNRDQIKTTCLCSTVCISKPRWATWTQVSVNGYKCVCVCIIITKSVQTCLKFSNKNLEGWSWEGKKWGWTSLIQTQDGETTSPEFSHFC